MWIDMIRITFAAVAGIALAGCMANPPPVVVDYNEASVKVQQTQLVMPSEADKAAVKAEAERICATSGRKAEYASTTVPPNSYAANHLFLCLK